MTALTDLQPQTGRPTPVRRAAVVDWKLLHGGVRSLESDACGQIAAVELVAHALQAEYVAWVCRDADGRLQYQREHISQSIAGKRPREAIATEVQKAAAIGMPSFSAWQDAWSVVVGYAEGANPPPVLAAIVPASQNPAMVSAVLQWVGLTVFPGPSNSQPAPSADEASTTAAALELVVRLAGATDMKSAAKLICDLVRRQLDVEHVAVGLVKRSHMTVEPAALSDVMEVDQHTEASQLLAACLTESLPQPAWVLWSKADGIAPVGLGHWQRLADSWQATNLAAVRFNDRVGDAIAVCLVASTQPVDSRGEQFLRLVGHIAGPLLRVLERAAQGHRLQHLKEQVPGWFKGRRAWGWVAAVALPLAFPWAARTTCPVVLEPVSHRLIAAPYEGIFDHSLVMPGDRVEAGQVLGRMDGRELRARLAACQADLSRAGKSRDVNLATGKLAAAQIDRLEMDRLEHECAVFNRRLEQLEVRSPIAGVVVTGDLRRYEAATLKIGQILYEIAPLDRLTAELAVPEEELEQVADEAVVFLSLDAVPSGSWEGRIERVHPRGELRDNRQVFIAETTLTDGLENLRPGMKGTATVIGPRSPGVWLLLRKPWYATRRFLGW